MDIISRMKNIFFLKLGIGILAIFGVLIAGFVFWKPLNVTYYKYQLGSDNPETHAASVKYLLESDAIVPVKYYYENRYASKDVKERLAVVDELCAFGDKGKELMREMFRERCKREMVRIPSGSIIMGSDNGGENENPVHEVRVNSFLMDRFEVTCEKYYMFVKLSKHEAPRFWRQSRIPDGMETHPVVRVSWEDADSYARWLGMRLPTEAEWEYACRAESKGTYCFGDNVDELGEYAWYKANSGGKKQPVGTKKPNKWGLFDMHGNVAEWCQDWYDENYYRRSPVDNPTGPSSGGMRIARDGCYGANPEICRSSFRFRTYPRNCLSYLGFRVVCSSSAP
jgi:formylglycine-generating enzyme required for sulfatase activity